MTKKFVVLIGFLPNPRILNRIRLECSLGEVHLICWDRGSSMLCAPEEEGYHVHIIHIPAGNDPIKRLIPTMRFEKEAINLLLSIKPDVIHVQGIDMLQIAVNYKKRYKGNAKLIYEIADLHRYIVDEQKDYIHRKLRQYLISKDRKLEKYYDILIVTSSAYYDLYFKDFVPKDKLLYIPNMPKLSIYDTYKKKQSGEFTIGYIGAVRYKKQIYNLIEAAKQCDVKLFIAGYEDAPIELEPLCIKEPNIKWWGRFNYDKEAPILYGKCDAMYSVYDADMANVRVALPNKLYESIYCEMPIIVAKNTYLAELVEKWKVGIAVDHHEPYELIEAINQLKDKETYEYYVQNCRIQKEAMMNMKPNKSLFEKLHLLFESEKDK